MEVLNSNIHTDKNNSSQKLESLNEFPLKARQNFTAEVEEEINKQINREFTASYHYQAMVSFLIKLGFLII